MVENKLMSNSYGTNYLSMTCSQCLFASLQSSSKQEDRCKSFHCESSVYTSFASVLVPSFLYICIMQKAKEKRLTAHSSPIFLWLYLAFSANLGLL